MLYHVMARTLTGRLGVGVAHLVAQGLRRGYGRAQIQHLTAEAKIVHAWDHHLKHANVMLLTVKQSHFQKHKKSRALKWMLHDVLKDL